MYRQCFYVLTAALIAVTLVIGIVWPPLLWSLLLWIPLALVGWQDLRSPHNVLYNYPLIGHLRYLLEFVRPELRQYFFESETSGRPFSREQRNLINARADGSGDTSPFGTVRDVDAPGYNVSYHSTQPGKVPEEARWVTIGGPQCARPYRSSRLNISAMSFGSLSGNAVEAMNHFDELTPDHIRHRNGYAPARGYGDFELPRLDEGQLLGGEIPLQWREHWQAAGVDRF